jgi:hypothetical protein
MIVQSGESKVDPISTKEGDLEATIEKTDFNVTWEPVGVRVGILFVNGYLSHR